MTVSRFVKGKLKILRWWPFFALPVFIAAFALSFFMDRRAGIVTLILLCAYLLFCLFWTLYWKNHLTEQIIYFAESFSEIQEAQLNVLPLPYTLVDGEGEIIWANASFRELTDDDLVPGALLSRIVPQAGEWNFKSGKPAEWRITYKDKIYTGKLIPIEGSELMTFAMEDMSELVRAHEIIEGQKPVYAQLLIDNYEEVLSSTEKIRQGLFSALIERRINKYFGNIGGLVHRLEPERFALTIDKKGLEKARADRFSILEDIKSISYGNTIAPTLSIGFGVDGEDPAANYESARAALELCLGRGGDQVVIRTPESEEFFGAKTRSSEKTSKVKARVIAQSLREMIAAREKIIVMGHANPDTDALGASVGVAHLARSLQKDVRIVAPNNDAGVAMLIRRLLEAGLGFDRIFISAEDALRFTDENTLLVVVDTSNMKVVETPALFELTKHIVNIDHHRKGANKIDNADLSYIEPFASSTSEMVTEMLDSLSGIAPFAPAEADALYAGIVIDTDNFLTMTGVRTFEAAAYLRRCGADVALVRKLLQDSMEDFKSRARAISNVEIYDEAFAFGICEEDDPNNARITGAKIANELLRISGVRASFVFTQLEGEVNLSARSIDDVNVQLICERLGGGGHMSSSGAQLKGCTVQDAMSFVKETIKTMIKEGAI